MSPYYDRSNLQRIPDLMKLTPQVSSSFLSFERDVFQASSHIPEKTKELIAIAVAHVTGCPYCIDVHVKKFRALGGTPEEMVEAVTVAASTRAGAILSHATHALIAYEEKPDPKAAPAGPAASSGPDCFC
ncbi:carboxymuconolactone decarboxylase family protein [Paenibacillus filicis]|uniref:Carboxymuconolactone decarboxylase family protein n=1 Tax=Paenibacillus filicis TaxID=669464 RepID=A0ABU9DCL0_9BACL